MVKNAVCSRDQLWWSMMPNAVQGKPNQTNKRKRDHDRRGRSLPCRFHLSAPYSVKFTLGDWTVAPAEPARLLRVHLMFSRIFHFANAREQVVLPSGGNTLSSESFLRRRPLLKPNEGAGDFLDLRKVGENCLGANRQLIGIVVRSASFPITHKSNRTIKTQNINDDTTPNTRAKILARLKALREGIFFLHQKFARHSAKLGNPLSPYSHIGGQTCG